MRQAVIQTEICHVITDQLFNALKAIETLALGTIEVYGLSSGQGLDRPIVMALACGLGRIIPAVQALALMKSINPHQLRLLLLKYIFSTMDFKIPETNKGRKV